MAKELLKEIDELVIEEQDEMTINDIEVLFKACKTDDNDSIINAIRRAYKLGVGRAKGGVEMPFAL